MTPSQTLEAYRLLFRAIDEPLSVLASFKDEQLNNLSLNFDFDPKAFTRAERLQLLRINSCLQLCIEKLCSIVEYVPYNFRKNKLNM